ncbi:2-hydroxyacyl-CoA dehydratase family protein [Nocardia carnea]|uniref:2-hydroxyacyl-CoA dehydratase family protein n=1 Tax=Nocardia TaxID=1817 RepID=UPI0024589859|nr:2-hydroxyacyl-CoA dehydratase family protein [Nocardia carnea]
MTSDTLSPRQVPGRLDSSLLAAEKQKAWFADFRRRSMENGEPYIIADGAAPLEIAHVMDIPAVSTVWYSSIIAAKKLSPRYFELANRMGYHQRLARYVSLPLFSTLDDDPSAAPYGGLPTPLLLLSRFRGDFSQRIFEQWANAFGVPHYAIDCTSVAELGGNWWNANQHDWEQFFGSDRLDHQVDQLESLVRVLETLSGKTFDYTELRHQMHLTNELGEIVRETADLIATAERLPVSLKDQLPNVMTPTWHRGSQWSIDHARTYQAEVRARIDDGVAICPGEKLRLMWLNNGLWFNTDFYRAFEEKYGAVFVWSMYTDFVADGYRRYFDDDPFRALAARHLSVNEQLHLPGWMNEYVVQKAQDFRIDGAVLLISEGDRAQATAANFSRLALERAGVPVHVIHANTVDERLWDADAQHQAMEEFIENRLLTR